jgi:type I restriction enzyme, S subunit
VRLKAMAKGKGHVDPAHYGLEPSSHVGEWTEKRLGEVLTFNYGWSLAEKNRIPGDYPVYGSNGIVGKHKDALVPNPGLIIGRKGSAGNVHLSRGPYCPIDTTFYVTASDTTLELDFLYYLLLHVDLKRITGDVGVPGLNREMAYLLPCSFPTEKSEQRKIAAVLGLVQHAIEQQEKLLALTAELKKALLHKLFTQGLHGEPQKQSEIGPVPESWEVVELSDVCTFQSGGTPSKQRLDYWKGTIPWVSPKDMKRPRLFDVTDHISEEALEEGSKLAPAGSVLVVVRGMILAKDVPVALVEVPMAINQDMKAIIPGLRLGSAFLLYAMAALKQKLFEKVGRSAHGTMTLMSSEIARFQIPMPDKQTQFEIAHVIETLEKKHDLHRREHAALIALFRTLLHQLMTAQIRVNELQVKDA